MLCGRNLASLFFNVEIIFVYMKSLGRGEPILFIGCCDVRIEKYFFLRFDLLLFLFLSFDLLNII